MDFVLRNNTKLQNLSFLQELRKQGKSVPVLDALPALLPGSEWLWAAFMSLSEQRGITQAGPAAISMSDLAAYCWFNRIDDADDRALLYRVIRKMDTRFLEVQKTPPPKTKRPPRKR